MTRSGYFFLSRSRIANLEQRGNPHLSPNKMTGLPFLIFLSVSWPVHIVPLGAAPGAQSSHTAHARGCNEIETSATSLGSVAGLRLVDANIELREHAHG